MKGKTTLELVVVLIILGIMAYSGFDGYYTVYESQVGAKTLIKEMHQKEIAKYKPMGDYIADNYHLLKGRS